MKEGDKLYQSDFDIALEKLRNYCVYQERCHEEVRKKATAIMPYQEIDKAIVKLIEEDFLNEERFSIAWAGGKIRTKKWGADKIRFELKGKKVSDYAINKSLEQYSDKIENENLNYWFQKKWKTINAINDIQRQKKFIHFAFQKGFDFNTTEKFLTERLQRKI